MIHDFNNHAMEKARVDNFGYDTLGGDTMNGVIEDTVRFNLLMEKVRQLDEIAKIPYLCEHCRKLILYHKTLIDEQVRKLTDGIN